MPHIRWMIRRDMPEVMKVENESFEFPWTEEEILACLRNRCCIGQVIEERNEIVGFYIYRLQPSSVELLTIAVAKDKRRRGYGRLMMKKLFTKLSTHRRSRLVFHVSDENLDAHLFLKKMGLRAVKVHPNFFAHDVDSYEFHYDIMRPVDIRKYEDELCQGGMK